MRNSSEGTQHIIGLLPEIARWLVSCELLNVRVLEGLLLLYNLNDPYAVTCARGSLRSYLQQSMNRANLGAAQRHLDCLSGLKFRQVKNFLLAIPGATKYGQSTAA